MNLVVTTSRCRKFPVRSSVTSAHHPLSAPRSPRTPSLPDAVPRFGGFRRGGRESNFAAAIDQHAIVRKRLDDMVPLIEAHPHLLGIAIDESTALEFSGGIASVMGKSKVAIYDANLWKEGAPRCIFLEKGQRYELATRQLLP